MFRYSQVVVTTTSLDTTIYRHRELSHHRQHHSVNNVRAHWFGGALSGETVCFLFSFWVVFSGTHLPLRHDNPPLHADVTCVSSGRVPKHLSHQYGHITLCNWFRHHPFSELSASAGELLHDSLADSNLHGHRPAISSRQHPLMGSDMSQHSDPISALSDHPASPVLLTSEWPTWSHIHRSNAVVTFFHHSVKVFP